MCPFSSAAQARGCGGPSHRLHLCRSAGEGCSPAHRVGLEPLRDDRESRRTGRTPLARPGSRYALFYPASSSAGVLSGGSTCIAGRSIHLKHDFCIELKEKSCLKPALLITCGPVHRLSGCLCLVCAFDCASAAPLSAPIVRPGPRWAAAPSSAPSDRCA